MTEQAWSLLSGNQTSVWFSKMIASLTLRDLSRPDCQEGKELCRGRTAFGACEMPSEPGGDDRMAGSLKLPFSNLEHELVDREMSVLAAQEPDRWWLTLGDFPDGAPDVALVDVNLSGLGEVEVFGPGVAVVVDELYGPMATIPTSTIFATVENVLNSNVPQDDCSFEDLFQFSHGVNRGSGLTDPPLQIL